MPSKNELKPPSRIMSNRGVRRSLKLKNKDEKTRRTLVCMYTAVWCVGVALSGSTQITVWALGFLSIISSTVLNRVFHSISNDYINCVVFDNIFLSVLALFFIVVMIVLVGSHVLS